jgi:hypothetical protein
MLTDPAGALRTLRDPVSRRRAAREGVAERHEEQLGGHELQCVTCALCLRDGPVKSALGVRGTVDAHHDAPRRVGHGLGVGPVYQHRAVRVRGAVLADRANEHPDEFAVAPTPDDEKLGALLEMTQGCAQDGKIRL